VNKTAASAAQAKRILHHAYRLFTYI